MLHQVDHKYPSVNFERLLTGDDIAQILNVSRALAYRLMQRGEIPTVHIGRAVRVRPNDLEAFITRNLQGSAALSL